MGLLQEVRTGFRNLSKPTQLILYLLAIAALLLAMYKYAESDSGKRTFRPKLYWTERKALANLALQSMQNQIRLAEIRAKFDKEQAQLDYRREMAEIVVMWPPQEKPDAFRMMSETNQRDLEMKLANINDKLRQVYSQYQALQESIKDIDSKLAAHSTE